MPFVTTTDGTRIFYKNWGAGRPVVLSHGWPLNSDSWEAYKDLADGPFFGHNRPGVNVSRGIRDAFWLQSVAAGHRNAYECVAAFSATDFRGDLARFDVPALVIHGDDDQVVPFEVGGQASADLIKGAELIVYADAPHGLTDTHKERLGADLLAFLNGDKLA
ncbi:hypothetical protein Aph01nite_36430 [Acrocarpospora phusangensis]|uniref:Non-heme chloroperoxidase n=1 Tax=Acrocarpospora phusangensis TaxID=1070424 RepID=A0A919QDA2_9ACTN|nr:alpha/beta hydrolase [Acrocarpospora phusangensis]GIH25333.1 hypothetical protein Aph01nite_36430 [Acrocarpospora phusangensis]